MLVLKLYYREQKHKFPKIGKENLPTSNKSNQEHIQHVVSVTWRLYKYDLTSFVRSVLYPTSLPSLSLPMTQQLANRVNAVSLGSLEPRISVSSFLDGLEAGILQKKAPTLYSLLNIFNLKL